MKKVVAGFILAALVMLGFHLYYPGRVLAQKPQVTRAYVTVLRDESTWAYDALSKEKIDTAAPERFPGTIVVGISCVNEERMGTPTVDCYVLSK